MNQSRHQQAEHGHVAPQLLIGHSFCKTVYSGSEGLAVSLFIIVAGPCPPSLRALEKSPCIPKSANGLFQRLYLIDELRNA
eukprot:7807131-Pyramimonas_sp.AAC.1